MLVVVAYHAGITGFAPVGSLASMSFSSFLDFSSHHCSSMKRSRQGELTFASFMHVVFVDCCRSTVTRRFNAVGSRITSASTSSSSLGSDVVAAAGFIVNMLFAACGTDYLAGDADPSIFQHYWSLAVEEQFYLIWPGLLAVVSLKAKKIRRRIAPSVALIIVTSFFASLLLTSPMPTWSYFGLHTRAFELGIGALLAVMWPSIEGVGTVSSSSSQLVRHRRNHYFGSTRFICL